MTVVFSDDFSGSGNWDSAKWTTASSGAATLTQVGGYGHIVTPSAGSYNDRVQARTKTSLTGGEARFDFTVDVKDTDYSVILQYAVSGEAPVTWSPYPQHGYALRYIPITGGATLYRVDNYALTSLGSATVSNVVGDVIHFAGRPGAGVYIWKNAASRPSSPTIASTDGAFAVGAAGIAYFGGGAATSRTLRFDNMALDDLAAAVPVTDFYAATSGGLVPLTLSFA